MKPLLCAAALAAIAFQTRGMADMLVVFNTRIVPLIDAPISRPDGTGAGAGINAQLFLVGKGGAVTPLPPATTFRTSSARAAFYVQPTHITIPGITNGASVTLRLRAWEGKNFETSKLRGESPDLNLTNNATVLNLNGLKGFKLTPPAVP